MPVNPKSLLNLRPKPFTSETGREAGKKKKDPVKLGLNRLEHGKYSKNKQIIEMITPTPKEKKLGIKKSDKIMLHKNLNPAFGANTKMEAMDGVEEMMGDIYTEILLRKQKGQPTLNLQFRYVKLWHQHTDRKFGNIQPNINIFNQQNMGETKLTMMEVHEKIIKKMQVQNETQEEHSGQEGLSGMG